MQVLKPEPELDFQIEQIVVNKSGVYAAVAGTHQGSPRLALLHLNQSVSSDTENPLCTSTPLAEDLLSSCSVLQMAWHPLHDDNLVILTSDARLSLYNVMVNPELPEQEYVLRDLRFSPTPPTSFAFPPADGWGYFTVL
eukprot:CAMPEP_0118958940 /NCGR_PEP_ID=MMETSP1169-20130426/62879_1 /TAXON_ID=36882 /ORGANISM="Pyramimonas obovata, Strain CCMP722" /LENGTH=138 /DNA_ID=CAMNT_0006907067 /DNA_START=376 /DNA_END=789 /DNA_ORIENTATION=+